MSMEESPIVEVEVDGKKAEGEKVEGEKVEIRFGFPEMILEILEGKKVARNDWPDNVYGILKDGFLMIHNETGDHQWLVSEADMIATDWEVIK